MLKTAKELRQARADKITRAHTLTAEFNQLAALATPTDDQAARLNAVDTELNGLQAEVTALDAEITTAEAREQRAGVFGPAAARPAASPALSAGRTVNEPNPETTGGFRSLAEFAYCVRSARVSPHSIDERLLKPSREALVFEASTAPTSFNMNQGAGDEGFLVPPDYRKSIWDIAFANEDILGMVSPSPTNSNTVMQPKDETTPWGANGVQVYWAAESAQLNPSKAQMTGLLQNLHKLYAFVPATEELLADAPMMQDRLTRQAGRALRWHASDAIVWGSGVGQPTGIMNSTALITVAKDAGQAAKTLSVSNILNIMAHGLRIGGRMIWIANQDIIPQLGQLQIGNVPAWLPLNRGLTEDPFEGTLMGYPIMFTEHAQTLGTPGDLSLVNLDGYFAATKAEGVQFASSIHLYFDLDLVAFRWMMRLAGQPYLSAPVQPAKGATTKSHFVNLAAR